MVLQYNFLYPFLFYFFSNDTAPPEIYTLSLHDALPILSGWQGALGQLVGQGGAVEPLQDVVEQLAVAFAGLVDLENIGRSEEHTSELQSHVNLVCRLLLEKKKITTISNQITNIKKTCHN